MAVIILHLEVKELSVFSDNRGWLAELLKSDLEKIEQVHFSVSKPGVARGNHFHKKRLEWMFVSSGIAKLNLEDRQTKEKKELSLSGDHPVLVKIYPGITHTILNTGETPMHLFILTSEKHSTPDTDTFYE